MKKEIMTFINQCEGWKTAIKNLHWSSSNMSEHKLFDDIADSVSSIQDKVAEIEQGIDGKVNVNDLKPIKYQITTSTKFLSDVLSKTKSFYGKISEPSIKSEIETFMGEIQQFQYLLKLCLKEGKAYTMNELRLMVEETLKTLKKRVV